MNNKFIDLGNLETNASSYNTSTTTVTSAETSTTTPATTPATTSATSTTIADTQSTTESIDTLSSTTESLLEIDVLGEGDGTNETETTLVDTTLESSPMNVTKTLIESILKTESVEAEEPAPTNATSSSKNTTITVRPPTNYFLDARIIVSRGCRPVDFIESTLGTGSYSDLRKYTQFCTTDLCNYGDGREHHKFNFLARYYFSWAHYLSQSPNPCFNFTQMLVVWQDGPIWFLTRQDGPTLQRGKFGPSCPVELGKNGPFSSG